jgi:hypothetical protein
MPESKNSQTLKKKAENAILIAMEELSRRKEFDLFTMMLLTTNAMRIIENYNVFTGLEKKEIVLRCIRQIVNTHTLKEGKTDGTVAILDFVQVMLPSFIDICMAISKGNIKIAQLAKSGCMSCLS